ncbi:FUSC family protein [Leifsonia sp. RAF41]|uniref:FUSC family protein n=1 Tax=Leifsonia sp. RAF41 TaxID=3233056 RepID=UPI003F94609B
MTNRRPSALLSDGVAALVTTAAAAGACATVWWLGTLVIGGANASITSAAVLTTVVALSLGRRTFGSRAEFARSALALPLIGLVAGLVGWLLVAVPPLGAALFVAGMSLPIWLRRFGDRASRLGALVALPFTAVLVAPVVPAPGVPPWLTALLVLCSGIVAILWVALAREVTRLARRHPEPGPAATPATAIPAGRSTAGDRRDDARRRLPASTRMAVQMAAALTAAFVIGWAAFPEHAMWVVLTAFLVCSGNRGRADVVHKSGLRILGALGGTVLAVAVTALAPQASGFGAVVLIFVALFAGNWLRVYSYAFWALAVTLVLTLLQQLTGTATLTGEAGMLALRMLAIVVGAGLGVAASWFVLPVRSVDVLRRRLSEMLISLGSAVRADGDPTERRARVAAFRASVERVEQLAPAHRATRLIRRSAPVLPIDCIDVARALPAALDVHLAQRRASPGDHDAGSLRSAIGEARKSLAAPVDLARVRTALARLAALLRGSS